jgi:hypothetical protein
VASASSFGGPPGASLLSANALQATGFAYVNVEGAATAMFDSVLLQDSAVLDVTGDGGAAGAVVVGSNPALALSDTVVIEGGHTLSALSSDAYFAATIMGAVELDGGMDVGAVPGSGALPFLISGPVTGPGTIQIQAGAAVELAGSLASTVTLSFAEPGGTIAFDNPSPVIANIFGGFGSDDTIELPGTVINSVDLSLPDQMSITTDRGSYHFTKTDTVLTGDSYTQSIVPGTDRVALTLFSDDTFEANQVNSNGDFLWSNGANWSTGLVAPPGADVTITTDATNIWDDVGGTVGILNLENGASVYVAAATTIGALTLSTGAGLSTGSPVTIDDVTGAGGVLQAFGAVMSILGGSDPGESYVAGGRGTIVLAATPAIASTLTYLGFGTFALENPNTVGNQPLSGVMPGDVIEVPGTPISYYWSNGLQITTDVPSGSAVYDFAVNQSSVNAVSFGTDPTTGLGTVTFEQESFFVPQVRATSGPYTGDYLWSDSGNWNGVAPTGGAFNPVVISEASNAPFVDDIADLSVQSLDVAAGTTVSIPTNLSVGNFTDSADIFGSGTITISGQMTIPDFVGGVAIYPFVTLAAGASIGVGAGDTLIFETGLNNDGTIAVITSNDPVICDGPVNGTGSFIIGPGDGLTLEQAVGSGLTIAFSDATGSLDLQDPADFLAQIAGFRNGDSLTVAGLSGDSASFSGDTLSFFAAGDSTPAAQLNFIGTGYNNSTVQFDASTGMVSTSVTCFLAGTRILTDTVRGEVAVEALVIGDYLRTHFAGSAPIKWIGHRRVGRQHPDPRKVWPVRVRAGAFANGMPYRDLWLSPDHAVFVGDLLSPIKYLINGTTVAQVEMAEATYFHIELDTHDVLFAEGLPTESFMPGLGRGAFDNCDGPVQLHPDLHCLAWEACGCAPLVVTGPLIDAIRKRLAARAAARRDPVPAGHPRGRISRQAA